MKRYLEICAHDVGRTGLWDEDDDEVDPDHLPISAALKAVLSNWLMAYRESASSHLEEVSLAGRVVARAFKAELPSWTIVYYDWAAVKRNQDNKFTNEDADPWLYEVLEPLADWQHRLALT